ncbi:hypothetical protein AOL_s00004g337 [Orbilia oligospora ATCC 24927]|uniref:F-box domain-containing protein n=1 Tax=Arthrobotrys oligospora (strain ATCC 24927 / CBS 115.81 / DSM 1491) TaxID=756982 RepID=G1WYH7_ARTOA|nr:hypothetical protein AOL_s00004g337 [Orbilia oligospora ATCC 24927]EGX54304.1 hypothetical protein AOL_s00004g337 [Orbilia oligospora ATCC 24927]
MYLSNLAPELLLNIISSLEANDLAQLVQTCRYLYNTGNEIKILRQVEAVDADTLKFILGLEQPYVEGWNYSIVRRGSMMFAVSFTIIDVEPGSKPRVSTLDSSSSAIFDVLADQIATRNKRIVDGKFRVGSGILDCDSTGSILFALKKYSHVHPASEFSIASLSTEFSLSQHDLSTFFDTQKLTKLSLRFPAAFWEYDYSMGFPSSEASQQAHFALNKKLLRDIENLRDLLLKVSNLEILSLRPHVSFFRVIQPLMVLPPALDGLGQAVEGLTKLHTLKISEYLFHPAFFLPVPKTVKKLQYKKVNKLSQGWWSRFAKAPLTNVESLSIRSDGIGLRPRSVFRESEKGFNIEDIEIKSLKRFICQGVENPCLPKDLVECINRRNTGLEQSVSY